MSGRPDMSDYVEVNERIMAFIARYPEGSLQAEIHTLTDSLVVMKAYAYRTADDQRPGIGWSSLQIPGKTNFTRDAEIENCETSAWGRAIAALGFEVRRGIASRQEVESKPPDAKQRKCSKHPDKLLSFSRKTGKWGHVLPDGAPCVEEEAA